ncbi:uncharacterized protein At2g33490-like isoform X2 [Cynara cardunculus var. scolymus]|uniref:uncharacterized protein At2g33490-like isoform X2 n=1 Tax=Cynara cardunculus var. scolymus TaxID=59895 RepID=UPI000D631368|nr:uncharacterized protein At2g33490-like isoform X2 [Cynara cardunculus var. scolymus]
MKMAVVHLPPSFSLYATPLPTSAAAGEGGLDDGNRKFMVVGHRGHGMNLLHSTDTRMKAYKENSILSFNNAANHPLDFIEFDVQVTKDDIPIIFHDNFILSQHNGILVEKRVTDLTLQEFFSYGPQRQVGEVGKSLLRRTNGNIVGWDVQADDHSCTLQEAFQKVNPCLGFNIELKFDDYIVYQQHHLTHLLQLIFKVVSQNAQQRPVIFSTFQPDAALLMKKLQHIYPVYFLTNGGTQVFDDVRMNSLEEAKKVAIQGGLDGIVSEVMGVFGNPMVVRDIKDSKLSLLTYGKLKLSLHKSDGKEKKDHQPSAHLDELAQASKDMQDMRNCYDGLLSAAAATANSIYEFSESLKEMGNCLLGKTAADTDRESGKVLSTLGNMQLDLQKIADTYRSSVVVTITNPSESLLSELRKVEEMKLQCDEKREAFEYMMTQHREKGQLRTGKVESSIAQKLKEAQDEYDEVTRLCVFRVKSLKEGQCRSLLTQAARHHAAQQLSFFRNGLKTLEAVEPCIRNVAEKHHIDYQLTGLCNSESREGEPMSGYESTDDGELSFDYRQKKQGIDDDGTSQNPMELDRIDLQGSNLEDAEVNKNNHQGEQLFGRQTRVSSYSAPLFPEKIDASERPKETQPSRKFYSYVLPPPAVDARNPISRPSTSVSYSSPFQSLQQPLPVDHGRRIGDDNMLTSASTSKAQSMIKDGNSINPSIQLPAPSAGRFSLSQRDTHIRSDGEVGKRQSYSGPLPPSKQFSFKIASNSGPITSTELPQPPFRVPVSQPSLSPNVSRSASPPPISSPKISELHELPRPPSGLPFSKPVVFSGGMTGHSAPLFSKNQEISPPYKRAMLTSTCAPLPPPPLVVPRSFSIPSSNQREMALHVNIPSSNSET